MRRKTALLTVLLVLLFFLPGCWSRYEVENLAIVSGMGIDRVKENGAGRYLLTINILRPALSGGGTDASAGGRGKPIYWRMVSSGKTLAEAERNLHTRSPRRIFFGHTRYALIGEQAAREGMQDIIDYLHRNEEIRLRILLLSVSGRAADAMINFPEIESTISRQVTEIAGITGSRSSSEVKFRDLAETTDQLITPGLDPVLARVIIFRSPPTEAGGQPIEVYRFIGGGVIKKDRLVGWLDGYATRGYLIAVGQARESVMPVSFDEGSQPNISIMMTRVRSKIKVKSTGNKVTAQVTVHAEGDLGEYHGTEEVSANRNIIKLEEIFGAEIEKGVRTAFSKSRELDADIFGIGAKLYQRDPKAWKRLEKDWYKILPDVELEVKVEAHIRRTGMISETFIPE